MVSTETKLPTKMHALRMVAKGPAESSLQYEEVLVPTLSSPTDVLVHVKAASINPVEAKLRAGNMAPMLVSTPRTLGADFAGDIVSVGAKVTKFNVGDAVYGKIQSPFAAEGTHAEYVRISTEKDNIEKKPEQLSYIEAGSVGAAAVSAYAALSFTKDRPSPENVLVIGASGGVGSFAVKLAKASGAQHIVGICSERNIRYVESIGATRAVNYGSSEDLDALASEHDQFDVVIDCVGGDAYYNRFINTVKKNGIFSTLVGPEEHLGSTSIGILGYIKNGYKLVSRRYLSPRPYRMVFALQHSNFADLHRYLEKGMIDCKVSEDQVFDLKNGVKAHQLIETHRAVGKVVLRIGEE